MRTQNPRADRVAFAYPSAELDGIVERYWWLDAGRPLTLDLWPGTGAEILWPARPALFATRDGRSLIQGPVLVTLRASSARVALPAGTPLLAVRLRASALARLGVDPRGFVDRARPFPALTAKSGADPTARPRTLAEGRTHFEAELGARHQRRPLARIANAIEAYYRAPAELTVPDAAELVGLSERQLRRDFVRAVGVGPKRFQRLVRFQRTVRSLLLDGRRAADPHEVGYADQSHQLHDFAAFTGTTPSALRRAAPTHTFFRSHR